MPIESLDKAIAVLGSQDALADALFIKSPSISGWRDRQRVPAERCIAIELATGGVVTRYQLRPDVFGADPVNHSASQRQSAARKRAA
jgi:DNA-binding transcriptional regulator YdaS (Cro superfamily)